MTATGRVAQLRRNGDRGRRRRGLAPRRGDARRAQPPSAVPTWIARWVGAAAWRSCQRGCSRATSSAVRSCSRRPRLRDSHSDQRGLAIAQGR